MNIDDFDEVVEDILTYLHRRNYKNDKQNMIKLKILWLIYTCCETEEQMKDIMHKLDKCKENEYMERKRKL